MHFEERQTQADIKTQFFDHNFEFFKHKVI